MASLAQIFSKSWLSQILKNQTNNKSWHRSPKFFEAKRWFFLCPWYTYPWKLTWNPKIGGLYSFSKGVFSGSMLVFRGVLTPSNLPKNHKDHEDVLGFENLQQDKPHQADRRVALGVSDSSVLGRWKGSFGKYIYIYILYLSFYDIPLDAKPLSVYSKELRSSSGSFT